MSKKGLASSLSATVLIICGAINALLSKVVYQLEGTDCAGVTKPFAKPWLQTALMFVSMALCLPIAAIAERWSARHKNKQQSAPLQHTYGLVVQQQGQQAGASDLQQPLLLAEPADGGGQHQHLQHLLEQQQQQQGRAPRPREAGSHAVSSSGGSAWQEGLLLCIPTGFDLAATTLMNVGLLYVAASVFQILRGSEMLFAALFSVLFLRRRLNRWHLLGVALCMAGISLVGVSRVLAGDGSSGGGDNTMAAGAPAAGGDADAAWLAAPAAAAGDAKQALLGMGLILLSQAIQAGQVTVEDHLMADMHMAPLKVVGWEGVIGSLVMLGLALPLLQRLPFEDGSGLAEDSLGSWCMLRSSPTITAVVLLSSLAVLIYNISGMYVTERVGAAARTVLENARTLLVWLAALALFYTHAAGGHVGEAWDSWSWLQAVGFAVFAAGALLYDKGHKQQDEEAEQAGQVPKHSQWAVLKSSLGIHTGHYVGVRRFRAAGNAVLAGVRAGRLAEAHRNASDSGSTGGDGDDSRRQAAGAAAV